VIVLPSFAAFASVWLRRRWGSALAIASCLLDVFRWEWLANYAARRFGGIDAYVPEYVFFALFYGSMILLAIKEYKHLTMTSQYTGQQGFIAPFT
jgi:hypothetical protein